MGRRGSIFTSPTACLLRGYGRAGTQNDRFSEVVNFEYRHVHTRAVDMPSAMPSWGQYSRHNTRRFLSRQAVHVRTRAFWCAPCTVRKALARVFCKYFSACADGERRGARSSREGGIGKVSGGAHRYGAPSDRDGSSALAVGLLRDVN